MANRDKENQLIENMGNTLAWICMGILEGKTETFEGKPKKLDNFFWFVQEEKKKSEISTVEGTHEMIVEAKGKRAHIYESCKKIPFSQMLYIAEVKGRKSVANPNLKAYLQAGYLIIGVWMDRVLQDHYRMSKATRSEIFDIMVDWIDSYQKGYLSNAGINEMYIEDLGYDLAKGEMVAQ